MTNFLPTWTFFDFLCGEEILLVLQHFEKLPSPKAHTLIPHKIFLQHAWRVFASSWNFSKRFKERKQLLLQIELSTFKLERGISNIPQILFRRSETFPFNFVLLLESFSSKLHNINGLYAIHLIEIFANKQTDLTAVRVLGGWIFARNGLRFHFRWHLRAHKFKFLYYTRLAAHVSSLFLGEGHGPDTRERRKLSLAFTLQFRTLWIDTEHYQSVTFRKDISIYTYR